MGTIKFKNVLAYLVPSHRRNGEPATIARKTFATVSVGYAELGDLVGLREIAIGGMRFHASLSDDGKRLTLTGIAKERSPGYIQGLANAGWVFDEKALRLCGMSCPSAAAPQPRPKPRAKRTSWLTLTTMGPDGKAIVIDEGAGLRRLNRMIEKMS